MAYKTWPRVNVCPPVPFGPSSAGLMSPVVFLEVCFVELHLFLGGRGRLDYWRRGRNGRLAVLDGGCWRGRFGRDRFVHQASGFGDENYSGLEVLSMLFRSWSDEGRMRRDGEAIGIGWPSGLHQVSIGFGWNEGGDVALQSSADWFHPPSGTFRPVCPATGHRRAPLQTALWLI